MQFRQNQNVVQMIVATMEHHTVCYLLTQILFWGKTQWKSDATKQKKKKKGFYKFSQYIHMKWRKLELYSALYN